MPGLQGMASDERGKETLMPYCPHCGNETPGLIPVAPPVAEAVSSEVEIARIQAERDIAVAKISARQDANWNETRVEVAGIEAAAEVGAAEATAEAVAAVIEAGTDTGDEPGPPVVIEAPDGADEDQGDDDELPPAEGSPIPEPKRKSTGLGFW